MRRSISMDRSAWWLTFPPEVYEIVRLFVYLADSLDADCCGGIRHPPCAQTHDLSLGLRNGQTKRRARGHDHIHHLPELLR